MYLIIHIIRKYNSELKKMIDINTELLAIHTDTIKDINKKICKLKRDNGVIL